MKKHFLSTNLKNIPYLNDGEKRLKALKRAGASGVRRYAPDDDVLISCDVGGDSVTVMDLQVSHYFGYAAAVDMRCWCRGVVLAETAAGASPTIDSIVNNGGSGHETYVTTVKDYTGAVVATITGQQTVTRFGAEAGFGTQSVTYTNCPYNPGTGAFGGIGIPAKPASPAWTLFSGSVNGTIVTDAVGSSVVYVGSGSWTSVNPSYESLLAAAAAKAKQRAAVFMTDGTELASAPHTEQSINNPPGPYTVPTINGGTYVANGGSLGGYYVIVRGSLGLEAPHTIGSQPWNGDGYFYSLGWYNIGSGYPLLSLDKIPFTVPDDACYQKAAAPAYPGAAYAVPTSWTLHLVDSLVGHVDVWVIAAGAGASTTEFYGTFNGNSAFWGSSAYLSSASLTASITFPLVGSDGRSYDVVVSPTAAVAAGAAAVNTANGAVAGAAIQWTVDWTAAQKVALTREQARRKKCSDGQLAYLRHGFLSPEFEVFIKQQHPVSTKVRRTIPMVVTNYSSTITETPNGAYVAGTSGLYSTTTTTVKLTLTYTVVGPDGNPLQKTQDFSGTNVVEHMGTSDPKGYLQWSRITSTTLPVIIDQAAGRSGQAPMDGHPIGHDENSTLMLLSDGASNSFWSSTTLMLLSDGVSVSNSFWVPTTLTGVPAVLLLDSTTIAGEWQASSSGQQYTHPQFLYDYIKASKPVEINPKIPTDLASTNWLSSRLAHHEIVTVIPLSFVNADGVDRGMYPYSRTDEAPSSIKLVGYAKFKYDYYKGTFSFVSWTEFVKGTDGLPFKVTHDGTATYDKETDPTTVKIGDTTYTLSPRLFAYSTAWATPNCVCIGGSSPWTDTKAERKTQKAHTAADTPIDPATGKAIALTDEEQLYKAIRLIIV